MSEEKKSSKTRSRIAMKTFLFYSEPRTVLFIVHNNNKNVSEQYVETVASKSVTRNEEN